MLNESQRFYEFIRDVEEEESWISEKQSLMSSNDFGDTLASVQGLIKKHTAFDQDVVSHTEKANLLEVRGNQLIEDENLQADKVIMSMNTGLIVEQAETVLERLLGQACRNGTIKSTSV